MKKLSVIVTAYNSGKTIESCLEAIRQSDYKNYELIVVDDASQDETLATAQKYADRLFLHKENLGSSYGRNTGIKASRGEILVFIDSDVVIRINTLTKIVEYLSQHEDIDAVTGLLAKEHPFPNYFSQYKNLYMHYTFQKLPEKLDFLYGSIMAIRRSAIMLFDHDVRIADDNNWGKKLACVGKKIAFVKDLEVVHLKKHSFFSFVRNDFRIPYDWAMIFFKYEGWKDLGKNKGGYLHAPRERLASVILAPGVIILASLSLFGAGRPFYLSFLLCLAIWFFLNGGFLIFLTKEIKFTFGLLAVPVTFFDHLVMASGIFCGWISWALRRTPQPARLEPALTRSFS